MANSPLFEMELQLTEAELRRHMKSTVSWNSMAKGWLVIVLPILPPTILLAWVSEYVPIYWGIGFVALLAVLVILRARLSQNAPLPQYATLPHQLRVLSDGIELEAKGGIALYTWRMITDLKFCQDDPILYMQKVNLMIGIPSRVFQSGDQRKQFLDLVENNLGREVPVVNWEDLMASPLHDHPESRVIVKQNTFDQPFPHFATIFLTSVVLFFLLFLRGWQQHPWLVTFIYFLVFVLLYVVGVLVLAHWFLKPSIIWGDLVVVIGPTGLYTQDQGKYGKSDWFRIENIEEVNNGLNFRLGMDLPPIFVPHASFESEEHRAKFHQMAVEFLEASKETPTGN